jgi:hypothetical protein
MAKRRVEAAAAEDTGEVFINEVTGEQSLPGESEEDFRNRTVVNGPEPIETRPQSAIAPRA